MAEPMSEDELRAIEAREEAATPGPWSEFNGIKPGDPGEWCRHVSPPGHRGMPVLYAYGTNRFGNLDFAAHARQDLPRLLAEVRRLRAALAAEREACARIAETNSAPEIEACQTYGDAETLAHFNARATEAAEIAERIRARHTSPADAKTP